MTERRKGHYALRIKDGKMETFDPHPVAGEKTMKKPKDINKYLSSHLAGLRLLHLALDRVAGLKSTWRVKWTLSVSYWCDDPDPGIKIIPRQMSWTSGDPDPEDKAVKS